MGGLSGSKTNSRFHISGKIGLFFYMGLWIRLLQVGKFCLGMLGMVRNDFENEIEFKWRRVVTLGFELFHRWGSWTGHQSS